MHVLSPSYCASVSSSPSFLPLCFILHYLPIYLQCAVISPSTSSPLSKGLVSFHNSWSCSYGSGNHVRCESVRLKGSLRLHHLIRKSQCSSYCTQVPNRTKSHLGHMVHANSSLLFKPPQTKPPFRKVVFLCFYEANNRVGQKRNIFIYSPSEKLQCDEMIVTVILTPISTFFFCHNYKQVCVIKNKHYLVKFLKV